MSTAREGKDVDVDAAHILRTQAQRRRLKPSIPHSCAAEGGESDEDDVHEGRVGNENGEDEARTTRTKHKEIVPLHPSRRHHHPRLKVRKCPRPSRRHPFSYGDPLNTALPLPNARGLDMTQRPNHTHAPSTPRPHNAILPCT
ncbi:hypothetical protein FA13DRAFT_1794651 [Coprinellus micaceus]|uniref:Uncharacterized protein n=1 Tax=Coprinellus micaceus TaxID=71717 RepID=A0A4Y7T223_COPMI|nr:hypothetical protein FA13DRAFT_1794651 [Coprinellus micaceus]